MCYIWFDPVEGTARACVLVYQLAHQCYIWFDPVEGTASSEDWQDAEHNRRCYIWFDPVEGTASF